MTTGEKLKKNLGLENIKNVKIRRAIVSSYKILFVYYDTYRPTMPITNYQLKEFPWTATIFHGTDLYHSTDEHVPFAPPINIEDYNGMLRGTLIVPVDLAGKRFADPDEYTKIFEKKLNEEFFDYVKSRHDNKQYALHVNPTRKEIAEIKREGNFTNIRGIYLSNVDKVFVANASLLHGNIRRTLESEFSMPLNLNKYGVYFTTHDKINILTIETISNEAFKEFLNTDFYNNYLLNYEIDLREILLETQPIILTPDILKEYVTLQDLTDSGNISDFTTTWWGDRTRIMKGASQNVKLIDCIINEFDKSVTFQFLTEATRLGNKNPNDNIDSDYRFYDRPKGETDPENNWRITRNRSEIYEIQIKVLDILGDEGWLSTFEGEKIGRKKMKEILEVSNVQISSTSPSFNWQGFAYWLTQIDASIYPQSIAPTSGSYGWKDKHGNGNAFLDKHTYSLLRGIDFFINQMAVQLTSKLRQRNLI